MYRACACLHVSFCLYQVILLGGQTHMGMNNVPMEDCYSRVQFGVEAKVALPPLRFFRFWFSVTN